MSDGDFQVPEYMLQVQQFLPPQEIRILSTIGVQLIDHERIKQVNYKKITVEDDYKLNADFQLVDAAIKLLKGGQHSAPEGWDEDRWSKMLNESDERRLVIAGALIAAEIDRLNYTQ